MTVSAFAYYNGGRIIFGISDNGDIVGLSNLDEACLSIENKINDSIKPMPEYTISVDAKNKTTSLDISRC